MIKHLITGIVLISLVFTLAYVRPGVWRYSYYESRDSYGSGISLSSSMRTDRLTGQVQIWNHGKWERPEQR